MVSFIYLKIKSLFELIGVSLLEKLEKSASYNNNINSMTKGRDAFIA